MFKIINFIILTSILIVSLMGCGKDGADNPKLVPLQSCQVVNGKLECK